MRTKSLQPLCLPARPPRWPRQPLEPGRSRFQWIGRIPIIAGNMSRGVGSDIAPLMSEGVPGFVLQGGHDGLASLPGGFEVNPDDFRKNIAALAV